MDIKELIRYNHIIRNLYFDALSKLPWNEVVKDKDLSFNSLRNVFLHLTIVEDRWISYIIPNQFDRWRNPDFDTYKDKESLKQFMQHVKTNTETYLTTLTTKELTRQITLPWGNQPNTKITIEKGLTHMVLEDMIHYGELSAALWQMGEEAPYMGFWRYGISEPISGSFEPKPRKA